jgi:hypothetical protein
MVVSNFKVWRNRHQLFMEGAQSHCKGVCLQGWEELLWAFWQIDLHIQQWKIFSWLSPLSSIRPHRVFGLNSLYSLSLLAIPNSASFTNTQNSSWATSALLYLHVPSGPRMAFGFCFPPSVCEPAPTSFCSEADTNVLGEEGHTTRSVGRWKSSHLE